MNDTAPTSVPEATVTVAVTERLMSPRVGYVDQVIGEGREDVTFRSFPGVRRRPDAQVVHLHRLSALGGARSMGGKERVSLALAFAASIKRNRVSLVRTWHGADAQGTGGRALSIANWIVNRVTTEFVVVDQSVRAPRGRRTTTIPFGHYRDRFVGYPTSDAVPGRIACAAPHLHRNAEDVVVAFTRGTTADISLRVVGQAPAARAESIEAVASGSTREITTRLERVSDGTLVSEITAAELVVIPLAAELDDLHVMLLSLSLDRPILVPDTALTRSLAASVGEGWVHRYSGTIDAAAMDRALAAVQEQPPATAPHLEGRDGASTAALYAEVFLRAASRAAR